MTTLSKTIYRFKTIPMKLLFWLLFTLWVELDSLQPSGLQHTRFPYPSLSPQVCSNSCPLSQCCHPTISSSTTLFTACPQFFSQHQGLFHWVGSSHQVAKVLELQLQHQFFQRTFRVDFLQDWLIWSPCCPSDSQESSSIPQFENINSLALSFLYSPTLTSIHNHWKNHTLD